MLEQDCETYDEVFECFGDFELEECLGPNNEAEFNNPYRAAELGYLDEIIFPEQTRSKIIKHFNFLKHKKVIQIPKKHGNIPL